MIKFVTSFSADGYERYARNMLESVVDNWYKDLHLTAYYHDCDEELVASFPQAKNIEYRNLNEVEDMLAYRDNMKLYDGTAGGKVAYNWRMDAVKWCHKVYAMTDIAFEISENEVQGGWLIWLDADTVTTKPLSEEKISKILPDKAEIVHLGRKDTDYSETSFVAFNLNYETPLYLLADLRGCYDIGETIMYREWHDGFIFERLLKIYIAHGMKAHNLTPNVKGLAAFKNSPLSQYMVHYKGNLKNNLSKDTVAPDVKLPRYKQLADLVRHYCDGTIVEVGTWNGGRAIEMALAAFEKHDKVHYVGFDLFEEATEESDAYELNSKPHNLLEAVEKRLTDFAGKMLENNKTFTFKLFKGDSKETLPAAREEVLKSKFAYIDGGHSEETVRSDYGNLNHCDLIVFDDYFTADPEGNILGEEHQGTNRLVKELTEKDGKPCVVLPSTDRVKGGGITHLAVCRNTDKAGPLPDSLLRVPIVVQPRDSMPKDDIIKNINENVNLIKRWNFVKQCKPNNKEAIIVSAGPSIDWKLLKKKIKETGGPVICVKHSYPLLLKNGIKPYACVILDPRPVEGVSTHGIVRKDLFETVDPSTKFLVASMTDVSATKVIMSKTDNVYGWHAYSEAIRDKAISEKFEVNKTINISADTTFVTGGTCSAMRAIGMFHILGCRTFHLFGFDCSVPEVTEEMQNSKTDDGKQKYMRVETNGLHFWTTGELLAMAQDCERLFSNKDIEMNLYVYGENTLVSEVFKSSTQYDKTDYTTLFKEVE